MGAILHQLISASFPSSQYDSDAQAYFNAVSTAGVTLNSTQKDAFNTFVLSCKSASIWTKFYALYPFIGATAATHAINAKSPGTYNITWNGTVTHSSAGSAGDGSSGYANTGIILSSTISKNDYSCGLYCTSDVSNADRSDMGYWSASSGHFSLTIGGTTFGSRSWREGDGYVINYTSESTAAFFNSSRISSSSLKFYRNASQIGSEVTVETPYSILASTFIFGGIRNGTGSPVRYSNNNYAFAYLSTGLSSTDVSNLYSAVQTLQTSLGRNV